MKNSVTITYKGKTYRPVVPKHVCTKRSCSLYRVEVCDTDNEVFRFPCDPICELLNDNGIFPSGKVCFKEVRT